MARPKKEKPSHGIYYEYKCKIGTNQDGSAVRKAFYSRVSKADAVEQARQHKLEVEISNRTGIPPDAKTRNFTKLALIWLESVENTVKSNTYQLTFLNATKNHIIPHFGKMDIGDIKKMHIQDFFSNKKKDFSNESQKKMKRCLNLIFEFAIDNDILYRNPCRNIKLSGKKMATKEVYTQAHVDLIYNYAIPHRFGLDIILLLTYGMRRSELLGLKWSDIDFDNRCFTISRSVTDTQDSSSKKMYVQIGETKNAYSNRMLPLTTEIQELLEKQPRSITAGRNIKKKIQGTEMPLEFIISNRFGEVCSPRTWSRRHYGVFMQEMQAYYQSQEPPILVPALNPHELRHTRASLWVNQDKNLFTIATTMGWGDLKMLRDRYAHADIESSRHGLGLE